MAEFKCYPRTDPNAQWNYCPSYGAAIAFSALFGLATVVHILQAILYKKPFAFVLIMGAAWETAGYIFRTLSVEHQLNESYGTAQQLLILLAPLWINAFVYMTLGRAIHFYLSPDKIFGIKARKLTLMFVLFDITAFVIQAVGGVMTTPSASLSTQRTGLHVYMGGVGLQLFFNVVFLLLGVRFQFILSRQSPQDVDMTDSGKSLVSAKRLLLYPLYSVLVLIVYRNIYRLIEFSAGVDSTITTHEWYTFVFDSIPMLFALIVFLVFHPGRVLRGPNSDFSEENKEMKRVKKEKKRQKKEAAALKKESKKMEKQDKKAEKRSAKEVEKEKGRQQKIWEGTMSRKG